MYEPTFYDKRFVEILDYLIDTRRAHKLFKTQKKFLEKISIPETIYPEIRRFKRGIPIEQRNEILKILSTEFKVNEDYIKHGTLPMFTSENMVSEGRTVYKINDNSSTRIRELEEMLRQKDTVIKHQQEIIEMYKGMERQGKLV